MWLASDKNRNITCLDIPKVHYRTHRVFYSRDVDNNRHKPTSSKPDNSGNYQWSKYCKYNSEINYFYDSILRFHIFYIFHIFQNFGEFKKSKKILWMYRPGHRSLYSCFLLKHPCSPRPSHYSWRRGVRPLLTNDYYTYPKPAPNAYSRALLFIPPP